jgi:hypothetical protein
MYINKDDFEKWMERIMESLDAINHKLVKITRTDQRISEDVILDNQDLLTILKISVRTLQRIRNSGKLPFHTINRKNYYLKSDVEKYIKQSFGKDQSFGSESETVEK